MVLYIKVVKELNTEFLNPVYVMLYNDKNENKPIVLIQDHEFESLLLDYVKNYSFEGRLGSLLQLLTELIDLLMKQGSSIKEDAILPINCTWCSELIHGNDFSITHNFCESQKLASIRKHLIEKISEEFNQVLDLKQKKDIIKDSKNTHDITICKVLFKKFIQKKLQENAEELGKAINKNQTDGR